MSKNPNDISEIIIAQTIFFTIKENQRIEITWLGPDNTGFLWK